MKPLLLVLAVAVAAGCGGVSRPKDDPRAFASKVVGLIVHNKSLRRLGGAAPGRREGRAGR